MDEYSLYFHLPFCKRKCDYCHFFVLPDKELFKNQLLQGLKNEWQQIQHLFNHKKLVSVYFGGGTPSLFGCGRIAEILSWTNQSDIEITLEVNPEGVTKELIVGYAKAGVNRISLGIQSLNDHLLNILSRTHTTKNSIQAAYHIHDAGIQNISIDLMYDIPHQTMPEWESTLQKACKLPITHISFYNLTFEPHTAFYKKRKRLQAHVPNEAISQDMYLKAVSILPKHGFEQYEISAFAKSGFQSKHNSGYWTSRPFLGLGPSAFSYWNGSRFRNVANLNKYCKALSEGKSPIDFEEKLEKDASLRERFVINLRLFDGVDLKKYPDLETLDKLINNGLITLENDKIKLTPLGILHYDTIASELI